MVLRFREESHLQVTPTVVGHEYAINYGTGEVTEPSPVTVDVGLGTLKRCWDECHSGPPFVEGGPFFVVHAQEPTTIGGNVKVRGRVHWQSWDGFWAVRNGQVVRIVPNGVTDAWCRFYEGGVIPVHDIYPSSVMEIPSSPEAYNSLTNPDDLQTLGARAYNRLRPKVEKAGLFQAVYEARDILPMLKTTGKGFANIWKSMNGNRSGWQAAPKQVAGQFLNVQFGWRPFVQDIQKTLDVLVNFEAYAQRVRNSNDKWQQKTFQEDEIVSEEVVYTQSGTSSFTSPLLIEDEYITSGSRKITRIRMKRVWYAGSFKYWRPEFGVPGGSTPTSLDTVRQYLTLLGANVNPVNIYKVLPWTWAIDWFVNVGDNIQVFQDNIDNAVVSRYMYLMREMVDRYVYESTFTDKYGATFTVSNTREVKCGRRVPAASNFGFSLPLGGLSGMQYAILGAVGISRR